MEALIWFLIVYILSFQHRPFSSCLWASGDSSIYAVVQVLWGCSLCQDQISSAHQKPNFLVFAWFAARSWLKSRVVQQTLCLRSKLNIIQC